MEQTENKTIVSVNKEKGTEIWRVPIIGYVVCLIERQHNKKEYISIDPIEFDCNSDAGCDACEAYGCVPVKRVLGILPATPNSYALYQFGVESDIPGPIGYEINGVTGMDIMAMVKSIYGSTILAP